MRFSFVLSFFQYHNALLETQMRYRLLNCFLKWFVQRKKYFIFSHNVTVTNMGGREIWVRYFAKKSYPVPFDPISFHYKVKQKFTQKIKKVESGGLEMFYEKSVKFFHFLPWYTRTNQSNVISLLIRCKEFLDFNQDKNVWKLHNQD